MRKCLNVCHCERSIRGFTLAEVLITLGIIGVVAALTMPSLIAKHKEKETVSKLKKVYSTLDNALRLAINEQGVTADNWGLVYLQPQLFADIIKPHLIISKDCGQSTGCWGSTYYNLVGDDDINFNDSKSSDFSKFILNDGTAIAIWVQANLVSDPDMLGWIAADLNNRKPPNKYGEDVFWFEIRPGRIIPSGGIESVMSFSTDCNISGVHDDTYIGRGCTAWVILNENMDYLHCDDLDWNSKTKCK
jgi:prepilin-type N-terminal cleavage/methylation domain-containing protein